MTHAMACFKIGWVSGSSLIENSTSHRGDRPGNSTGKTSKKFQTMEIEYTGRSTSIFLFIQLLGKIIKDRFLFFFLGSQYYNFTFTINNYSIFF